MMLPIDPNPYRSCSECHRRLIALVELGQYDERGHYDQESGASLCADCLREALRLIETCPPAPQEEPTP